MSIALSAKPGEKWDRSYPREWWDNRDRSKGPSQGALNRTYQRLEEIIEKTSEPRNEDASPQQQEGINLREQESHCNQYTTG